MAWLRLQRADVVGFCEANGWEDDVVGLALKAGYNFSAIFPTRNGFPLAVFSRTPIDVVGQYDNLFERGVLHVVIRGLHFFIAHLNAHSSRKRAEETAVLSALVKNATATTVSAGSSSLVENTSNAVVMGDLNTLSPLDAHLHANMTLEGKPMLQALLEMRCYDALRRKFVTSRGTFDYRAMQNLLTADLVDVSEFRRPTEPTNIPCDQAQSCTCPHLRLDYMLVSDRIRGSAVADVVIDAATDVLSDHYPILGYFPLL